MHATTKACHVQVRVLGVRIADGMLECETSPRGAAGGQAAADSAAMPLAGQDEELKAEADSDEQKDEPWPTARASACDPEVGQR